MYILLKYERQHFGRVGIIDMISTVIVASNFITTRFYVNMPVNFLNKGAI